MSVSIIFEIYPIKPILVEMKPDHILEDSSRWKPEIDLKWNPELIC